MKSSIPLGRIWGIELGLHYSWVFIALLITLSLGAQFRATNPEWGAAIAWAAAIVTGMLFFAALFAHELSHAAVAKLRGLPIHRITLFLLGGMAQIEKEPSDAATEFWMAIAGPIMSVVLGLACLAVSYAAGWTPHAVADTPIVAVLVWLGYINLILAAFNMIPGFPLDGGRVLRAIVWWVTRNERRATMVAARVGQMVAFLFIAWGLWRFFNGAGFGALWMTLVGWFLLQAAGASYAQVEASVLLRDLKARDIMSRECESVPGTMLVRDFVHQYLLRTGVRCFIVAEGGQLVGLVTPHEVKATSPAQWSDLRIADIMLPARRIHAVSPETPVYEALQLMTREDVNQVPVVEQGHLTGVLRRGDVLQVLSARESLKAA